MTPDYALLARSVRACVRHAPLAAAKWELVGLPRHARNMETGTPQGSSLRVSPIVQGLISVGFERAVLGAMPSCFGTSL